MQRGKNDLFWPFFANSTFLTLKMTLQLKIQRGIFPQFFFVL